MVLSQISTERREEIVSVSRLYSFLHTLASLTDTSKGLGVQSPNSLSGHRATAGESGVESYCTPCLRTATFELRARLIFAKLLPSKRTLAAHKA